MRNSAMEDAERREHIQRIFQEQKRSMGSSTALKKDSMRECDVMSVDSGGAKPHISMALSAPPNLTAGM
ncbi:hypothetical protein CFIMG_003616RA [Ceratocystis fimbriata CBS 114723]|uniref:Uncharacterized protein n=1 Tax=Ceratocystis fimbriata CBS 114723 TaxID=1035309 RepID=A0A2C5XAF8_9PEZI|nr:hypothetical protein CFIMG_003616RA [Ceratocystis fimbriata CBS 114723]